MKYRHELSVTGILNISQITTLQTEKKSFLKISKESEEKASKFQYQLALELEKTKNLNDKYNTAQLRFFTIDQEYENLKSNSQKEISHLQNS